MCTTLPEVLVTVMGIEKVVPSFRDLEVMLQLLPRSSTGERMNPYTSIWTGVHSGDGPRAFHLVLLDNGRTRALADEVGRDALRCIRCSACVNVCPVYRQTGGHAYHTPYPGRSERSCSPSWTGRWRLGLAAVRLDSLRRLRGCLSGANRHPRAPCARAREGRRREAAGAGGSEHEAARTRLSLARPLSSARSGWRASSRNHSFATGGSGASAGAVARVGAQPRSPRRAAADVPGVVGVR